MRSETYPDSVDGTDKILFEYNRQSEIQKITDQEGTIRQFDYDKLGRQTHDRITTLGTGVDGAVRRISTTYEVRGMRVKSTSHNNATVGSGTIVDETQFSYNNFAQLIVDYQAHSGADNVATSVKVQYGYANGLLNTIRPTTLTYPNGEILTYNDSTAVREAKGAKRRGRESFSAGYRGVRLYRNWMQMSGLAEKDSRPPPRPPRRSWTTTWTPPIWRRTRTSASGRSWKRITPNRTSGTR